MLLPSRPARFREADRDAVGGQPLTLGKSVGPGLEQERTIPSFGMSSCERDLRPLAFDTASIRRPRPWATPRVLLQAAEDSTDRGNYGLEGAVIGGVALGLWGGSCPFSEGGGAGSVAGYGVLFFGVVGIVAGGLFGPGIPKADEEHGSNEEQRSGDDAILLLNAPSKLTREKPSTVHGRP